MNQKQNKILLKRMLFLELTGVFAILFAVAAIVLLVSLKIMDTRQMIVPGVSLAIVAVFILLSVRYARRDIHKIHELHAKPFYRLGRYLIYGLGLAMIGYTLFLFLTQKDMFSDIGAIIEAELILVLGVFILYYTYMLHYLIENEHLRHEHANFWDVFWVVLFPVILVAGSVYVLFSQSAVTVSEGKADFSISPTELMAEFDKNDSLAGAKYNNKIIRTASHVVEISGDSAILIKLAAGSEGITVNCGFDKSQKDKLSGIVVGDSIEVQCSCGGYSKPEDEESLLSETFLELNRCALIKHVTMKPRIGTDIENPTTDTTNK